MPANDYMPDDDSGFSLWVQSFANGISADPARFLISPAEAAVIQSAVSDFVDALLVATTESTRTKPTILAKDNARAAAQALCRQYAMLIKDAAGINDEDKVAIGVRAINPHRRKIECPQSSPLLKMIGNTPGVQELRFSDTNSSESRARPFGAIFLELRTAITDGELGTLEQAKPTGLYPSNPVTVKFDAADNRRQATHYGRWVSKRGETGPWSLPVSMSIAA